MTRTYFPWAERKDGRRIIDLVKLNARDMAYIDKKCRFCIVEQLILEKKTEKFNRSYPRLVDSQPSREGVSLS